MLRLYDPRRVKAPMVRTNPEKGPDVDPGWKEISWDEAMDLVESKLPPIREPIRASCSSRAATSSASSTGPGLPRSARPLLQHGRPVLRRRLPPDQRDHGHELRGRERLPYCPYWLQIGSGDGFRATSTSPAPRSGWPTRARGMQVVTVEPRMSPAAAKADEWVRSVRHRPRLHPRALHSIVLEHGIYDRGSWGLRTNAPYLIGSDGGYLLTADGNATPGTKAAGRSPRWDEPDGRDRARGPLRGRRRRVRARLPAVPRHPRSDHAPERMEEVCTVPGGDDAPARAANSARPPASARRSSSRASVPLPPPR